MKRFIWVTFFAALLPLAACSQSNPQPTPTPPAPNNPQVNVETPRVDVKSDQNGTTVKTPNNEVDVNKK